jgi:hypothetical protein
VTTTVFAPGSLETDPKKQNMALQDHASKISANTDDIATNTADIATNTADIATNAADIATNTADIATNTADIATLFSIRAPDVIIEDQKAAGTAGGGLTSGANTRTLNTLVRNVNTIASLASNNFSLGAGTYYITWSAPAWQVNQHQTLLRNVSDTANTAIGTSEYAPSATDSTQSRSTGGAVVTIATSKTFAIFHSVLTTKATNGAGLAANHGSTEVYCRVEITKLA